MKNPFRAIVDIYNDKFNKDRNKIESEVAKAKGTKKETARSKGGGGIKKLTANSVAIDNTGNTFMRMKNNAIIKRRVKRKMAKKSNRTNRLHRQYHKAA